MDISALIYHALDVALNSPARYIQSRHFDSLLTLILVIGYLLAEFVLTYIFFLLLVRVALAIGPFLRFALRKFGVGEKDISMSFLELTFPSNITKSAFATEQLHILMQGTVQYQGFWDRLAARKKQYSLELVATHDDGIRYVMVIPTSNVEIIQRNLLSFLPGLKIREIDDYIPLIENGHVGIVELQLASDFILPLHNHKQLIDHDPIAYITGHMTKLIDRELIAFQIVTTPIFNVTHSRIIRRKNKIEHRIALGKKVTAQFERQRTPLGYILWLLWFPPAWFMMTIAKFGAGLGEIIGSIFSSDHELPGFLQGNKDKRAPDNPYEQELEKTIKSKLDQPLFEVSIRVLVNTSDTAVIKQRLDAIVSSFQPFRTTHQAFRIRQDIPFLNFTNRRLFQYRSRTLSPHHLSQQTILSSSELSDLYHFPNTDFTKTEGLVKSRSRELPTPLSMKHSDTQPDVIVGVNQHGGKTQPIGITLEQRQKHTYVIGKTGTGKTTLLTSSIYQDMLNGKGLAVLDPHGDMFQELLNVIPEHRRKDVVVFDPSDRAWPVGLNLLDPGIDFADEDEKNEKITSSVLSVFAKLADESQWGPRMEHILRNATMTALQVPNPSLYTLQRLLTDKKYQRTVAKDLKDPVLKQFWDKEFALLGSMQLSSVTAPLTHRLGHFITTKMSRHILLQQNSSIRIADIMNEGKILLANLSKGDIGEDQSRFFGTILTSFIWMAAYQRTKTSEKKRRDFFLYVDEFQNFASPDFSDIVSEGRKYRISLIVSHQSIAQIEDKSLVKLIAGNASTLICLKVSPEDETFILPYMRPEVERGDIVNLAPYHFYMKTTSDVSEDAFSGLTVPLDVERNDEAMETVLAESRKQYGMAKADIETYMTGLFNLVSTSELKVPSLKDKSGAGVSSSKKRVVRKKLYGG